MPVGLNPDDEISIVYERNEERTQVVTELGGVKIIVSIPDTEAGVNVGGLLVQALPGIMEAAYQALEEQEEA
jgi:hypothetical protein